MAWVADLVTSQTCGRRAEGVQDDALGPGGASVGTLPIFGVPRTRRRRFQTRPFAISAQDSLSVSQSLPPFCAARHLDLVLQSGGLRLPQETELACDASVSPLLLVPRTMPRTQ